MMRTLRQLAWLLGMLAAGAWGQPATRPATQLEVNQGAAKWPFVTPFTLANWTGGGGGGGNPTTNASQLTTGTLAAARLPFMPQPTNGNLTAWAALAPAGKEDTGTASNALVSRVTGATNDLSAFTVTSIGVSSNAALASDLTTSNGLLTVMSSRDVTTSNALSGALIANDVTTSNGLLTVMSSRDVTTSNTLSGALIANDVTTSNGLLTVMSSRDVTTSNALLVAMATGATETNVYFATNIWNTTQITNGRGLFGAAMRLSNNIALWWILWSNGVVRTGKIGP